MMGPQHLRPNVSDRVMLGVDMSVTKIRGVQERYAAEEGAEDQESENSGTGRG